VSFPAGQVIVRGKLVARGKKKRADYMLPYKKNLPRSRLKASGWIRCASVRSAYPRASRILQPIEAGPVAPFVLLCAVR